MPVKLIAPTIAIAVNLPLAVWGLVKAPRDPAYRLFAAMALSLVVWNLGSEVFHHQRADVIWMRLSFVGMALAPANFLCLALVGYRTGTGSAWWHLALYAPMLLLGLALDPAAAAQNVQSPGWRVGFYRLSEPDALIFAGVTTAYLAAASLIAWLAARRAPQAREWVFYFGLLPLVAGILCVLAAAYLRSDRTPTVSLWTMVLSQYTMFMMIRHRWVSLELSLHRGIVITFTAIVLAALLLMGIAVIGVLFNNPIDPEMGLILVIAIVASGVLFAALLPRLESLYDRFVRHVGTGEPPAEAEDGRRTTDDDGRPQA